MKSLRRRRTQNNEDGFVLMTVLGISFLAVIIVSSIVAITLADLMSNARARGAIEARHTAESTLDSYYAVINASKSDDIVAASNNFAIRDDSGALPSAGETSSRPINTAGVEPVVKSSSNKVLTKVYPYSASWFSIDDDGYLHECGATNPDDGKKLPCFRMRLVETVTLPYANNGGIVSKSIAVPQAGGADSRTEYSVDIVVRHMCMSYKNKDKPTGCIFSRYQQNIRKRDFVRHVVMSETENVAPQVVSLITGNSALAQSVRNVGHNSYTDNDSVTGNIHTNGSAIYTCNTFQLASPTYWLTSTNQTGGGSSVVVPAASTTGFDACNGTLGATAPVTRLTAARPEFTLPSRTQDETGSRLKSLAQSEDASHYYLQGDARIVFSYDPGVPTNDTVGKMSVTINGVTNKYAVPSFGVVYVTGSATVSGVVKGKVTVFAQNDITVGANGDNDLNYYSCRTGCPATMKGNVTDMIGLITQGDIILHCETNGAGRCNDKTVRGLLWAASVTSRDATGNLVAGKTIYNDKWFNSPAGSTPPTLDFRGSMISAYRGTFAAMDSTGNGNVTSGWLKKLVYDDRFASQQPPYMLRDALAIFIRSTTRDLSCDAACA